MLSRKHLCKFLDDVPSATANINICELHCVVVVCWMVGDAMAGHYWNVGRFMLVAWICAGSLRSAKSSGVAVLPLCLLKKSFLKQIPGARKMVADVL